MLQTKKKQKSDWGSKSKYLDTLVLTIVHLLMANFLM